MNKIILERILRLLLFKNAYYFRRSLTYIPKFNWALPAQCILWSTKKGYYLISWSYQFQRRKKSFFDWLKNKLNYSGLAMLGVMAFQWEAQGISKEELETYLNDSHLYNDLHSSPDPGNHSNPIEGKDGTRRVNKNNHRKYVPLVPTSLHNTLIDRGWECILLQNNFAMFRKFISKESTVYTYKVYGRLTDVTPIDFYIAQTDLEYRKSWDEYITCLEQIDEHRSHDSQLLYWIAKYPYPMKLRDYVIVRRTIADSEKNMMAIYQRTASHPAMPPTPGLIRVDDYSSCMIIYPHIDMHKIGLDYHLTTTHDTQTSIPNALLNWTVNTYLPDYLERLHTASREIEQVTTQLQQF